MTKPERSQPISLDTELIADLSAEERDAAQIRGGASLGVAGGGAARQTVPKTGGGC